MLNVGGAELLIILLVALVFLGPERLPDVARQVGQAVSSMRSLASGFQAEIDAASKPATDAMKLDGPTDQAEAIAQTQSDPFAGKTSHAPRAESTRTDIDPESLREAVRKVEYDDDDDEDGAKSGGGPTDLRDEEE